MIYGKLNCAFAGLVRAEPVFENFNGDGFWEKANVFFEGGKPNEHSVLLERGHLVAYGFLGLRGSFTDGLADLLE